MEGLVGRGTERRRLEAVLAAARDGPGGVLALQGEPGIGKSALLGHARERAAGLQVIATRGVESESHIAFGGLTTLLRPLTGLLDELPGRQAQALAAALALGPPAPTDPLTLGAATLSLLGAAADRQPLLVLVDDAHWLDDASASALLFAARRLETEPVALLIALRQDEGRHLDLAGIEQVSLGGLDPEGAEALLARSAGRELPEPVVQQLLAITTGNPLGLLEVPATLTAEQLSGAEPLHEPVEIGQRIEDAFGHRAAGLAQDTRQALLVAAASDSEDLRVIGAALTTLGIEVQALESAEAAGLATLDADSFRFTHPLARSALYGSAGSAERRAAHRALAEAVSVEHGSARAWHLAAAAVGPDEEAATALEAAAAEAQARGALGASAAALERAGRLSQDPASRAARWVAAARLRLVAGSAERADVLLQEVLPHATDDRLRADLDHLGGQVELLRGSLDAAHRRALAGAERLEDIDPGHAAMVMLDAALPCFMAGRLPLAVETSQRAKKLAEKVEGPTAVLASTVAGGAMLISLQGAPGEAEELVRSWEQLPSPEAVMTSPSALLVLTQSQMWLDEHDKGLATTTSIVDLTRGLGALGPLQMVVGQRAELQLRLGNWVQARADCEESIRLARDTGQELQAAYAFMVRARLDAAASRAAECRENAELLLALAEGGGMSSMSMYAGSILCLLSLGLGDVEAAARHGGEAAAGAERFGMHHPTVVQWRPDYIEALQRSGRVEEAAEQTAEHARRTEQAPGAWARATVERCRGLCAGDDGEAVQHFTAALAEHSRGHDPFERARTQLCLGERLRRMGNPSDAREPLRSASETFEALGAEPWARRARGEIRASGGFVEAPRGALAGQLTPQELQVALAVARGATNREAAAALFISPKTVEAHLGRIYRKLDVRGRTELAALMADRREGLAA